MVALGLRRVAPVPPSVTSVARNSRQSRGMRPRPPRPAPDRRTARRPSGRRGSRRGASSRPPRASRPRRGTGPSARACPRRAIDRSGWIVGQTQLTLPMSVLPEFGSVALVGDPVGGRVGRPSAPRASRLLLHRHRAARERHLGRGVRRQRGALDQPTERALHRRVVRLVGAPHHEPGLRARPG